MFTTQAELGHIGPWDTLGLGHIGPWTHQAVDTAGWPHNNVPLGRGGGHISCGTPSACVVWADLVYGGQERGMRRGRADPAYPKSAWGWFGIHQKSPGQIQHGNTLSSFHGPFWAQRCHLELNWTELDQTDKAKSNVLCNRCIRPWTQQAWLQRADSCDWTRQ